MKVITALVIGFALLIIVMSADVGGQQNSPAPQPQPISGRMIFR